MRDDLRPLEDDEFEAAVQALITDAEDHVDQKMRPQREAAWAAYWGAVGVEADEGGSDIVVPVIRDTVRSLIPDIMEILAGHEAVVEYTSRTVEQEKGQLPPQIMAEKATLLAHDVFWQDCSGWKKLHDAALEAIVGGLGCLRPYKRRKTVLSEHKLYDPDPMLLQALGATPGVHVGDPERHEPGDDGAQEPPTYPIKHYQVEEELLIEQIPAAEMIFNDAPTADECRIIGQRNVTTRGDLVSMGIVLEEIEGLTVGDDSRIRAEREAQQNRTSDEADRKSGLPWSLMPVTLYQLFVRVDKDGDGLPELWRVLVGGDARKVLRKERAECQDYCPFQANAKPGEIQGLTLLEVMPDLQDARTEVLRDAMDNAREVNSPLILAGSGADHVGLQEWRKRKVVRENLSGAVRWFQAPPTLQHLLPMLEHLELETESRVGISRVAQGLDPDALTNVTATAIQGTIGAAQRKQEMVARTIAETGLKQVFQKLLKLLVGTPERAVLGKSGEMEIVSPHMLDPTFTVRVKVGLGPAARAARTAARNQMLGIQIQAIGAYGPDNPLCGIQHVAAVLQDIAADAGLRYDRYFRPTQEVEAMAKQAAAQPKPDPAQQKIEADAKIKQGQLQLDAQQSQAKLAQDKQTAEQKLQQEYLLAQQKLQAEFAMRREEMAMEGQLKVLAIATQPDRSPSATNIPRRQ